MKVGCHVSIRGGYLQAAKKAHSMGARCFQYFPKNPRKLSTKAFNRKDADACAQFCHTNQLESVAHAPYPTNLAADSSYTQLESVHSVLNDLEIVEVCGSIGVVVHFGKYKGNDPLQGYRLIVERLNQILSRWDGNSLLLLENQAGQGVRMGTTLEELVQIRKLTDYPEQIGFCLDTCHAFASGLWNGANWQTIEQHGNDLDFFSALKVVHLNDSMFKSGSFRDQHANIGQGYIGTKHIQDFLRSDSIQSVPLILETPTSQSGTHEQEIEYVYQLATH